MIGQSRFMWYNLYMTILSNNSASISPNSAVKSTLARLLAVENIHVTHEHTKTASFNLKTRTLSMPIWKEVSFSLQDMLLGHEVSHALHTPLEGWKSAIAEIAAEKRIAPATAKSYLNIVEDARIERLIKTKFPGLRVDFFKGYGELIARGFFGDISKPATMCFADRMNLHFKCGLHCGTAVQFSAEEQTLVVRASTATTWQEVVEIAKAMIDASKGAAPQQEAEEPMKGGKMDASGEKGEDTGETSESVEGEGEEEIEIESEKGTGEPVPTEAGEDEDGETDEEGEESDSDAPATEKQEQTATAMDSAAASDVPVPQTDGTIEKGIESLTADAKSELAKIVRVALPDLNIDTVVVDYKTIQRDLSTNAGWQHATSSVMKSPLKIADYTQATAAMSASWNRKKAADTFRRTTIAKTGHLDTLRMTQWKWNDDIFRKTTRIAEGKNHGIVILLDWSGSMNSCLQSTIGQLFILTDFCRKNAIPFEVFAFSDGDYLPHDVAERERWQAARLSERNNPESFIDLREICLFNFLSSSMTTVEYELGKNILWNWRTLTAYDSRFKLNGTPTNTALLYASTIVEKFIARTRVQCCHTIVLTDGEATDSISINDSKMEYKTGGADLDISKAYWNRFKTAVVLTDEKTGASYDIRRCTSRTSTMESGYSHTQFGNFRAKTESGYSMAQMKHHMEFCLDILRRRTGTKIHWIGLTDGGCVSRSAEMKEDKTSNMKRDGYCTGVVAGWDSSVVINSQRFSRDSSGAISDKSQHIIKEAESKLNVAVTKKQLTNAFMDTQMAHASLRSLATIIGEYLAF